MLFLWGFFCFVYSLLYHHPLDRPSSFFSSLLFSSLFPFTPFLYALLIYTCYRTKDPQATVKTHIKLLHDYNEIRDVGQGLMGIMADNRGVRVRDVYQDFDVGEGD